MTKYQTELAELFQGWQAGTLDKWDVYPAARVMMDKRQIKLADVIELGAKYCNISEGVIKMRMRYMKQLTDQVTRSYNTLKAEGVIR